MQLKPFNRSQRHGVCHDLQADPSASTESSCFKLLQCWLGILTMKLVKVATMMTRSSAQSSVAAQAIQWNTFCEDVRSVSKPSTVTGAVLIWTIWSFTSSLINPSTVLLLLNPAKTTFWIGDSMVNDRESDSDEFDSERDDRFETLPEGNTAL